MGLAHKNWRVVGKLASEITAKLLLRFGARTVQRLMEMSKQPPLTHPTQASDLPPSLTTFHEVTMLPDLEENDIAHQCVLLMTVRGRDGLTGQAELFSFDERSGDPRSAV
jgi:hypothetical protein